VDLDRKSPPFANGAKDGAPSSSRVRLRKEERSHFEFVQGGQEWLCYGAIVKLLEEKLGVGGGARLELAGRCGEMMRDWLMKSEEQTQG
jgi:hypothetical protein